MPAGHAPAVAHRPRGLRRRRETRLDTTSLLVHDVSILPVNGISREPETARRAHEWLDDLVVGRLFLPTSSFPLSQLPAAAAALRERPSHGRVAILPDVGTNSM